MPSVRERQAVFVKHQYPTKGCYILNGRNFKYVAAMTGRNVRDLEILFLEALFVDSMCVVTEFVPEELDHYEP